jgi:hypothetical protein
MTDSTLAFVPDGNRAVVVNFGVFAGREATQAEIERLGATLVAEGESFAVVAERRYRFGPEGGASLMQVRVEPVNGDAESLLGPVEAWASECIAERSLI